MAPRAYWKGRARAPSCPTQAEKTHFHQINTKTGDRLKQQLVDEPTGRVIGKEHKGRGYELSKDKYVEIGEEELEAVKLESSHTIDIDDFVPADEIDERYLDKPYYIVLDVKLGAFFRNDNSALGAYGKTTEVGRRVAHDGFDGSRASAGMSAEHRHRNPFGRAVRLACRCRFAEPDWICRLRPRDRNNRAAVAS